MRAALLATFGRITCRAVPIVVVVLGIFYLFFARSVHVRSKDLQRYITLLTSQALMDDAFVAEVSKKVSRTINANLLLQQRLAETNDRGTTNDGHLESSDGE